jgi:YHS domain-containing protein
MGFLIRMFLYVFMIVGAYMLLRKLIAPSAQPRQKAEPTRPVSQLVQDPNCGVYLDVQDAVRRSVGNGQVFFCSETCANAWQAKRREA